MDENVMALHMATNRFLGADQICDGRKRYATEEEAGEDLSNVLKKRPKSRLTPSPCPFCDGWHLRGVLSERAMQIISGTG